jgi:flagellar hook-basal body complex protein FliE
MRIQNDALLKALAQGPQQKSNPGNGEDFGNLLMDAIKEVNATQGQARAMQDSYLAGQPGVEVHDVMVSMEKASVAMQLTMQVRNKVLESYQELARMQI